MKKEKEEDNKKDPRTFINKFFEPYFGEYIERNHTRDNDSPSFNAAESLLGWSESILSSDEELKRPVLDEKLYSLMKIIRMNKEDEELKISCLDFLKKIKKVYGIDKVPEWMSIFVTEPDKKKIKKLKKQKKRTLIVLLIIIISVAAYLIITYEPKKEPYEIIVSRNVTSYEDRIFEVNKTITESWEIPIDYTSLLEKPNKMHNKQYNLTGHLTKKFEMIDNDTGSYIHFIVDDYGKRIIVKDMEYWHDKYFPEDNLSDKLFELQGILKDRYDGLTLSVKRLYYGKQPKEYKQVTVKENVTRRVNVTIQINKTVLITPD